MKKSTIRKLAILFTAALSIPVLAGCGNSYSNYAEASTEAIASDGYYAEDSYAYAEAKSMEIASEEMAISEEIAESAAETPIVVTDADSNITRKLIYTLNLSLETTEYDALSDNIASAITEYNGYVESSSSYGSADQHSRNTYLTIRIPAENLDAFETSIKGQATVTARDTSVQDVTLQYSDLETHIESLKIEQETLLELLAKAEDIDTILAIQSQLAQVRYELESYGSQLKIMQNQVSYSTVNINIKEVTVASVPEKQTFGSRLKTTFDNSIANLKEGLINALILFLGNIVTIILFLVVASVIILVIVLTILKITKKGPGKKKGKKPIDDSKQSPEDQDQE